MKRTQQLQVMVDNVNHYLRNNRIKDEGDPAFHITMYTLLDTRTYKGFNYFKDKQIGDKVIPVLAGSSIDYDYLQLY